MNDVVDPRASCVSEKLSWLVNCCDRRCRSISGGSVLLFGPVLWERGASNYDYDVLGGRRREVAKAMV